MTRSDLTHLYFLLDRSGSMQSIKSDIEGGFAAFIEEQRLADKNGEGECLASLAQFDDVYEVVYTDVPVKDVPALDLLVAEDGPGRVRALAPHFEAAVHGLKGAKHVLDIRNYGLAAGITIDPVPGEPAKRPFEIAMNCWKKGFYVRYGADTIQLAPPFVTEKAEIDRLVGALGDALAETA